VDDGTAVELFGATASWRPTCAAGDPSQIAEKTGKFDVNRPKPPRTSAFWRFFRPKLALCCDASLYYE
jgi:hypothetical protein